MPEAIYRLTSKGKIKLRALLEDDIRWKDVRCRKRTSKGQEIWNRSWLHKQTELDHETIKKIVSVVDPSATLDSASGSVQESTLIQLFCRLGCPESEVKTSRYWIRVETTNDTIAHRPEQLVKLLRILDYKQQQREFEDHLERLNAAAFLITAPCDRSQRWAIHHLAYKINNCDRAVRTPLIDVSTHQIRQGNVDVLWRELAAKLKIASGDRDTILAKLSQTAAKRPLIIALYNFGAEDLTPCDVIRDFWEPLMTKLSSVRPTSRRSQIVLLMADCNIDIDESGSIKPLSSLDAITLEDVKTWLDKDEVSRWCGLEFSPRWVDEFIQRNCQHECPDNPWSWDNPGKVLDRLCFEFGLENGIESLRRKWEW